MTIDWNENTFAGFTYVDLMVGHSIKGAFTIEHGTNEKITLNENKEQVTSRSVAKSRVLSSYKAKLEKELSDLNEFIKKN